MFKSLLIGSSALALVTLTAGMATAQQPAEDGVDAPASNDVTAPADAAPLPPADAAPPSADQGTDASPADKNFRPLALTLNPLSFILGRYGLNAEYMIAPHHGIMINPYFSHSSVSLGDIKTTYSGFGGELGYHFYTGSKGADGFFVGPSFVFTHSGVSETCGGSNCGGADAGFSTYGVALDLGGQHVFDNGFTIGGGAGLMYLKSTIKPSSSTFIKFEGVIPRFLFTVGYSL